MKSFFILLIIFISILAYGCSDDDIGDAIVGDLPFIGWITQAAANEHDSSMPNKISNTDNLNNNEHKLNNTATLKNAMKDAPSVKCPAHQYWNQLYYACMCEADYYMQNNACILKSSRQCVVDRDCSPNGQLSVCVDGFIKRVYQCDLNTYRCIGGKGVGTTVDCRIEYGKNSKCSNGLCT